MNPQMRDSKSEPIFELKDVREIRELARRLELVISIDFQEGGLPIPRCV